jgi:hypothetical protein
MNEIKRIKEWKEEGKKERGLEKKSELPFGFLFPPPLLPSRDHDRSSKGCYSAASSKW